MNFKILFLTPVLIIAPFLVQAQTNWCATDQYNEELLNSMSASERQQAINTRNKVFEIASNGQAKSGTVYTVPVVVHVIHDNCDGNISLDQIRDGIRILNEDFRRLNSDTGNTRTVFKPYAADIEIQFELARLDPNGNCTEGVVRINSPLTYNARNNVKSLSYWNSSKYLNVWLVNSIESFSGGTGITLGFAQFPGFGNWSTFGLVCRNDYWGTIGTSNSDGRTATHEVGHCFGLYHTFQGSCGSSCQNTGDRVCDTPPTFEDTYGCVTTQNTCSNDANGGTQSKPNPFSSNVVDQIENYMSYDRCTNMFSTGQANVMRSSLSQFNQLSNLVSSANLIATGTSSGYHVQLRKPTSHYCQENVSICEGGSVTYVDRSYNGPASTRNWSFPGGSPATSSDSMVTITYNTAGSYSMTLNVSNSKGTSSKSSNNLVKVLSQTADFISWKYQESFEDDANFNTYWQVVSNEGRKWELTDKAAYTGKQSVYLFNYINSVNDLTDELITPSYDLSAVLQPKLSFKVAYARKSASTADLMRIYYSYTCGQTWNILGIQNGISLESVSGFRSQDFIPADQSEWKEVNLSLSSFVSSKDNVRFKFEFISGLGNNIFLDDISVVSLTGIDESDLESLIDVYPNPVTELLTIQFPDQKIRLNQLAMMDLSGRIVMQRFLKSSEVEGTNISWDVSSLKPGLYLLQMKTTSGSLLVKKVMVK
ncbi:MAG: M43 family zinc metalloprotease [Vicingaceae bacterium]